MPENEAGYVTTTASEHVHTYTPAGSPEYARKCETAMDLIREIDIERREQEAKRRMWEQIGREILDNGYTLQHGRRMRELLG